MTLRVALQMDPIDTIDITGDSSFVLGLEAEKRGFSIFHYLPDQLTYKDGSVNARMRPLSLRYQADDFYTLGDEFSENLENFDVVLLRQDPPFDMGYISTTHLLERIHPATLVVNDPAHVRNAPEKLFILDFPELLPPTLISRDPVAIHDFRKQHGDLIVKPLFGNGGAGIFHITPDNENLNALLEMFFSANSEPIMVQRYLPDVRNGDKRIILFDGKPVGATNRVPKQGEARSNMHVGGRAEPTELTKRDLEICEAIGPELEKRGLVFTGIDVIGDYMTEINVTSPTGLQEINRFDNTCLESDLWDVIENKL